MHIYLTTFLLVEAGFLGPRRIYDRNSDVIVAKYTQAKNFNWESNNTFFFFFFGLGDI